MERWSHSSIKEFKTIFFIDTNILCYLVDNTYPIINGFIEHLKNSPLVELISSEYVLLEFVGVRKREHYLRESLSQATLLGKQINLSSLLKFHNQYSLPEIDFHALLPNIKSKIDSEKERISSEFGITFNCGFHRDLYNPTSEICLSTKISKEDSLVLISSLIPRERETNENVIILTNDNDFYNWYFEKDISSIFQSYDIAQPEIQHLNKIKGEGNSVLNLIEAKDIEHVKRNINCYILSVLKTRLEEFFVGTVFTATGQNIPPNCICLNVDTGKLVKNRKYISIIGKDLDFVYNSGSRVPFWNNGREISADGFTSSPENSHLSFLIDIAEEDALADGIVSKLKEPGNLIFIHPHS